MSATGRTTRTSARRGHAVVTGAGGGLGREIAVRLARAGFAVHVTDLDGALAEATAAQITATGPAIAARGHVLDVRDQEACRALAQSLAGEAAVLAEPAEPAEPSVLAEPAAADAQPSSGLTVWVNNAGVLASGPFWEQTDAQRRLILEVNALGTMHGTVAALEVMRPAGHGHVLNIASLAGLVSVPGEAAYAASKHAVLGFSTSALTDLRLAGVKDVRISCICPDGMWTPMLFDKLDDPGASMSFSGQLLRPEAIAEVVLKVVERPRPVTVVPAWRGVQVRAFDLLPGLTVRLAPLVVRLSRVQQGMIARRLRKSPRSR
ncbi:SDR family NAD(P)-dependent oxidoreductase [Brachybacterium sp. 107]|uniref:SDR family NAD(P)-dependent oxidoreductase n=1 Tax=Brachybacterium sp. 107 TaxID=3457736 RepID=UPI004033E6C3